MTNTPRTKPTVTKPLVTKPSATPTGGAPTKAKPTTSNRSANLLKSALVGGSLVATIMGANLAAQKDQAVTTLATTSITAGVSTTQSGNPQQVATVPNLATDSTLDNLLNTQLAPIPTINIPTVVTSSRSSR